MERTPKNRTKPDDLAMSKVSNRATKAELERRVSILYAMMARGVARPAILRFVQEEWGLSEDSLDRTYLPRVRELLSASLAESRDQELALAIAQRDTIIDLCMRDGKLGLALQALDSKAKLLGLFDYAKAKAIAEAVQDAQQRAIDEDTPTAEKLAEIRRIYGIYQDAG